MRGPTARARARKRRADDRVAKKVRAVVAERDGYCRLGNWEDHPADWHDDALEGDVCDGDSEWAHLGDTKRFKTRGLPPEARHTTAGSLMLCTRHHHAYDTAHTLLITGTADDELRFRAGTVLEMGD